MNISIFGLGYVGAVTAACLAREGHRIIGVDISREKVAQIAKGVSPIVEGSIGEIVAEVVAQGMLRSTVDTQTAILETETSIICVGTPSKENGDVDLTQVLAVSREIGRAIARKGKFHTLIYRSTVPPGTVEGSIVPCIENASGFLSGTVFEICFNPEFMREGSSVEDFYHPPFTLVGCSSGKTAETVQKIFSFIDAPFRTTSIRTAEMLKYVCNTWHALKVCFGNEVGTIARRLGVDGHEVMDLFMLDIKQNLSGMYLKPAFAYGGSCLPKDVRGILYQANKADFAAPLLSSIPQSNERHLREGFSLVTSFKKKKIGILGLAFKSGTDDLRESPLVILAEMLIGKGYEVMIYDKNVNLARIVGSNKTYIETEIPHLERLLSSSVEEVARRSEVIVIGNADPEYARVLLQGGDREIIDLAHVPELKSVMSANYHGICW
jgi:GDP-mannose 6-dehydrogenase